MKPSDFEKGLEKTYNELTQTPKESWEEDFEAIKSSFLAYNTQSGSRFLNENLLVPFIRSIAKQEYKRGYYEGEKDEFQNVAGRIAQAKAEERSNLRKWIIEREEKGYEPHTILGDLKAELLFGDKFSHLEANK